MIDVWIYRVSGKMTNNNLLKFCAHPKPIFLVMRNTDIWWMCSLVKLNLEDFCIHSYDNRPFHLVNKEFRKVKIPKNKLEFIYSSEEILESSYLMSRIPIERILEKENINPFLYIDSIVTYMSDVGMLWK